MESVPESQGRQGWVWYVFASFQTKNKYSKRDLANKRVPQLVPKADALENLGKTEGRVLKTTGNAPRTVKATSDLISASLQQAALG